ncbi:hypothetical protein HAX54_022152, partial [Datura stramonium]|nr:hypothetical protein [Datura stramonium]
MTPTSPRKNLLDREGRRRLPESTVGGIAQTVQFESISSSRVSFFSNPSVELFKSALDPDSSSESDIAPHRSTNSFDEAPSDGPVHDNSTTSNSHDESLIDGPTLDINTDPE